MEARVIIMQFLAHLTHVLQPLDAFYFRSLKQEIRRHKAYEEFKSVKTKWDIISFLEDPLYHASCKRVIKKSFVLSGTYPPRYKVECIMNKSKSIKEILSENLSSVDNPMESSIDSQPSDTRLIQYSQPQSSYVSNNCTS